MRWGTLERVPHTPQNFSRTNYYWWEPTFAPGSSLRLRSCMAALAIPAAVVPEGGLPFWLPAAPAFSLISSPIPPAPFPAGRGRPRFFSCKGLRPLHPRGCTRAALAIPAAVVPEGGLPCWSPAAPAFSFVFAPIPPTPFPAGRGRPRFFSCKGLRPLHPRDCTHGSPRKRQEAVPYEQCRQPRRGGTGGEELRRLRWSSPPGQG